MEEKITSKRLLDKVYNHLDTIDVAALSMNELKDFLEVVQKGQFLESYGSLSMPSFGSGFFSSGNQSEICCSTRRPDQEESAVE